ncbi:MAG: transposase [Paludibacteraceae bacterium]
MQHVIGSCPEIYTGEFFSMSKENMSFLPGEVSGFWIEGNHRMIKHLKEYLSELDQKIETITSNCSELNRQNELLMSISGVGKTVAVYMIIATKGFTSFKNSRKFACYAGIALFEYPPGTSIRVKTRVSPFADKKMKSLLHMAVLNAVRCDTELKTYYERKKQEGLYSLLVHNNEKCKLIEEHLLLSTANLNL